MGFLQPVCFGQPNPVASGVCWHPSPPPGLHPDTPGSQHSSSKDRAARAAPDAGMQRDTAGTPHQGHAMGHPPALHRALGTGCRSALQTLPRENQAGGSCGMHPPGQQPRLLSALSREAPDTSGSCCGTSQPSSCSCPVTIAVSMGLPSLSFLPLLSTFNYHIIIILYIIIVLLCASGPAQGQCHTQPAQGEPATSPQLSPQTSPAATSAIG